MASTTVVKTLKEAGRKKMDSEERALMERELGELKEQLKPKDPKDGESARPDLIQDKDALVNRIRKIEECLNMDDDLVAKGDTERARLSARKKEIESIIRKEMPTARQQALRETAGRDFNKAVEQTIFHQKKYGTLIQEWQEIMKRLEPEDPSAWSTERLIP